MKIKVSGPKSIKLPDAAVDFDLVQERMQVMARHQAEEFAKAMTIGLHEVAELADQSHGVEGVVPDEFSGIKEDADHVQFVARERPHSLVGDHDMSEVEVVVDDKPVPSGRDPETVVGAFEFGSAALDVPATQFTRRVEQEQERKAGNGWKGILG